MHPLRLAALAFLLLTGPAQAGEIRVLTSGAVHAAMQQLAAQFDHDSGSHVLVRNDTAGGVAKRVAAGEACDIALSTPALLQGLVDKGSIRAGSIRPVGTVGIAVAVKSGAAKPDISNEAAFKATMLAATSITYIDPASGGSSGIYVEGLLKRLGIYEQVAAKIVRANGGLVGEKLLDGSATIALQQMSELRILPGIDVLGPLPATLQNVTHYAIGLCGNGHDDAQIAAFLAYLHSGSAGKLLQQFGVDPES